MVPKHLQALHPGAHPKQKKTGRNHSDGEVHVWGEGERGGLKWELSSDQEDGSKAGANVLKGEVWI